MIRKVLNWHVAYGDVVRAERSMFVWRDVDDARCELRVLGIVNGVLRLFNRVLFVAADRMWIGPWN